MPIGIGTIALQVKLFFLLILIRKMHNALICKTYFEINTFMKEHEEWC